MTFSEPFIHKTISSICSYLNMYGLWSIILVLPKIKAYPACCRAFCQEDVSTGIQCFEEQVYLKVYLHLKNTVFIKLVKLGRLNKSDRGKKNPPKIIEVKILIKISSQILSHFLMQHSISFSQILLLIWFRGANI